MATTSTNTLSAIQGKVLLSLARQTIAARLGLPVSQHEQQETEKNLQDKAFNQDRGTFVTLQKQGQLRGCIGTITPVESISEGIRRNAINAAFGDSRFPSLSQDEFTRINIELSILTDPSPLNYIDAADLLSKIRPNIDGIIIRDGMAGATFLPQVWEQLPRSEDFLSHLCLKAGLTGDAWQTKTLEVQTYQVQHFSE